MFFHRAGVAIENCADCCAFGVGVTSRKGPLRTLRGCGRYVPLLPGQLAHDGVLETRLSPQGPIFRCRAWLTPVKWMRHEWLAR
jgi:hypothetical protein